MDEFDKNHPQHKFKRSTFSFTKNELARIMFLENLVLLAQTANNEIQMIINRICLPRVGVKRVPDMGLKYDTNTGVFYVFTPKG